VPNLELGDGPYVNRLNYELIALRCRDAWLKQQKLAREYMPHPASVQVGCKANAFPLTEPRSKLLALFSRLRADVWPLSPKMMHETLASVPAPL
jgi:hypothetical protein